MFDTPEIAALEAQESADRNGETMYVVAVDGGYTYQATPCEDALLVCRPTR